MRMDVGEDMEQEVDTKGRKIKNIKLNNKMCNNNTEENLINADFGSGPGRSHFWGCICWTGMPNGLQISDFVGFCEETIRFDAEKAEICVIKVDG
jgi:hypothetical protein